MKPSEAPAAFIAEMIGNLYDRPSMYVRTLQELDSVLYFAHYLWAEIADCRDEYQRAGGWGFERVIDRTGIEKAVAATTGAWLKARDDYLPVIQYWQQVDRLVGIDARSNIENPQFD